jgi:hypothetical protein
LVENLKFKIDHYTLIQCGLVVEAEFLRVVPLLRPLRSTRNIL